MTTAAETPTQQIEKIGSLSLHELITGLAVLPTLRTKVAELEAEMRAMRVTNGQGGDGRKKWLNLSESAERLGCSQKTITRWIKAGALRRNNRHRRVLIPIEDIENFSGRVTFPSLS